MVTYELTGSVATIGMDDGKVNALSPKMLAEINEALDRAEGDNATVVLAGREGIFSAGFDLKTLRAGGEDAGAMVMAGFETSARLLSYPRPVVVACTGHAIAMGVFLVLSGDYRVGAEGPFRLVANEVQIGLTMPYTAIEVAKQRLTPAAFNRSMLLSETFSPEDAVGAGFLDRVVDPAAVVSTAQELAGQFAALNMTAHTATKSRVRADALDAVRRGMQLDGTAAIAQS